MVGLRTHWRMVIVASATAAVVTACQSQGISDSTGSSSNSRPTGTALSVASGKWFGPNALSNTVLLAPSASVRAVRMTLERTPGPWSLAADGNASASLQPDVTQLATGPCIRDQYVAAAMSEAWIVEAYARLGDPDRAYTHATAMNSDLRSAYQLCSNAPAIGGGTTCATLRFVTCDDLRSMTS